MSVLHEQQQYFEHGIRQVFEAGGGAMTLVVVSQASSVALAADAVHGAP